MTSWIRENFQHIALVGIGVGVSVGVIYALLTTKPREEPHTDRVTSQAVVKFLAKKALPQIELQDDKISDKDLAAIFMSLKADCNEEVAKLRRQLSAAERKALKEDATAYAKHQFEKWDQEHKLVEQKMKQALDQHNIDENTLKNSLNSMSTSAVMDTMKEQGFEFIALDQHQLFDIAKFAAEYHDSLEAENPDMLPEIKRRASLEAAAEEYNVDPHHIELSLAHHDSVNDPKMQPFLSKISDPRLKNELLPTLVSSLIRSQTSK